MVRDPAFDQRILENMTDGVVTIDLAGKIVTFNPAAAAILGVDAAQLLGSTLAEHFFGEEANDDFNQVILDAVYQSQTTHNRVVAYKRDDGLRWLSVTTSFLRAPCEEASRPGDTDADGAPENLGVIILIDDVTEVEALRAVEAGLKEDLESKHKELQTAYLSLEERNRRIEVFTKRARLARYFATGLVLALVLGAGGYGWHTGAFNLDTVVESATVEATPAPQSSFTVTPTPISSNIRVVGTIQPGQIVNVVGPFDGVVGTKFFRYGDPVERDAVVLELDTDELESKLRDARGKYIKAEQQVRQLKNWRNSPEVVRAQRSVL
ncbi:MAG: PAS domain S-box protein, partial [Geminicoccaceae bacterium]